MSNAIYQELLPEHILQSVERLGLHCDGHLLTLNSYENRVYQIGLEDNGFLIAKFYRPNRWNDQAISEEHHFTCGLKDAELPVVAPLCLHDETLHRFGEFRYALFPRCGGRWPELEQADVLLRMGRTLGRMHGIGSSKDFHFRSRLSVEQLGRQSCEYLLTAQFLPQALSQRYREQVTAILTLIDEIFSSLSRLAYLRIHGDCHPGNILWTPEGPLLVDFDDCCMGPAIQDLWMLLSGDREQMTWQLNCLLEGYRDFFDFNSQEFRLIEPLRTLRMIHYTAWLAKRWSDPAFPHNFPWFNTYRFWEDHLNDLGDQLQLLQEPPLIA